MQPRANDVIGDRSSAAEIPQGNIPKEFYRKPLQDFKLIKTREFDPPKPLFHEVKIRLFLWASSLKDRQLAKGRKIEKKVRFYLLGRRRFLRLHASFSCGQPMQITRTNEHSQE